MAHCTNRYTHANRFCPDHPGVKPKRSSEIILQPVISAAEDQEAVYAWLERYKRDREEKTPGKAGEGGEEELGTPKRSHEAPETVTGTKLRTKRGLASEMEQTLGQENVPSPPRPAISRSDILRTTLTAHQSLNQALLRAAERSQPRPESEPAITDFRPYLDTSPAPGPGSPVKSLRKSLEETSPMRSIRRTLGEITPSKNCKVDNVANLDYDLPFPLDLNTLPGGFERLHPLPMTPLPAEKCLSPAKSSPPMIGSPAIKLKKRFQERFQEEKQQEDDLALARPISWLEEDAVASARSGSTPATPMRRDRQDSPSTFLVAAALMELHDSPTRISGAEDVPLNLTKK